MCCSPEVCIATVTFLPTLFYPSGVLDYIVCVIDYSVASSILVFLCTPFTIPWTWLELAPCSIINSTKRLKSIHSRFKIRGNDKDSTATPSPQLHTVPISLRRFWVHHVFNSHRHAPHASSSRINIYLPGEGESRENLHHLLAEVSFSGVVLQGHVQRVAEHVFDLVPVHHPHPFSPKRRACSLKETHREFLHFSVWQGSGLSYRRRGVRLG